MRGFGNVVRALKHHVLEQMRKTSATFRFVTRADVVVDADGNDRHRLVLIQDNAQSIVESKLFDRRVWNLKSFLHVESDPNLRWINDRGRVYRVRRGINKDGLQDSPRRHREHSEITLC